MTRTMLLILPLDCPSYHGFRGSSSPIIRPEPGILLILAFDIVLAGCFVPLVLGLFWRKSNTPGALAAIVGGTLTRIVLHFVVPETLSGLDTLLAPVASLTAFVGVALATQRRFPPRHHALLEVPSEAELVVGDADS